MLPDVSGDDEPGDETAAAANGGLDEDEHISMRGELWSDEDESFEDSEAGKERGILQAAFTKGRLPAPQEESLTLWKGCSNTLSMLH